MARKPSMKKAEWITANTSSYLGEVSADDVYDILLGQITSPTDLVAEVQTLSEQYDEDLRRHNVRD